MSNTSLELPKKYKHKEIEEKWIKKWEEEKIYRWNPKEKRENTFIADTPPPTVSGSLHIGHVYSYTQTDLIVRYQRMQGKNIFYPMGWDDNGLPTERRVQNVFGITCDPKLPYNTNWKPQKRAKKDKSTEEISRKNFIEACHLVTQEDEKVFETLWRHLGLSVDWTQTYATIDKHCQRISQASFLDLVKKGKVYNAESVTMWDVDFKTAVAQAEVEDRELQGAYHDITFGVEGSNDTFIISTTRPELLPACIAVAAHPEDKRYTSFFGKKALTPLFGARVPIVASEHADPEKGSGILMICTFGDVADVDWWKKSKLPARQIISEDGKLREIEFGAHPFDSANPEKANKAYNELKGLYVKQAKKRIVELLSEESSHPSGKGVASVGEPKTVLHPVRFYEKGDRPLEYITTRQWFINILDYKKELIEQGSKINWYPSFMKSRYDNWVEGLNQDWCISRQRYFGVPMPVWYEISDDGTINYNKALFPERNQLPVDPQIDCPEGFSEEDRGQAGGFAPDPDVMDTWGTSSLTPQLSSHWSVDGDRHAKLFPADLRPQAHEIIRTWAFYTIVKAWMHEGEIPWKNAAISGFILDPDRKKMSKSKGNAMTPENILENHSSDVVRYWASKGRLGVDTIFDETQFKIGRKLVTKIFNASKFVIMQIHGADAIPGETSLTSVCEEFDKSWLRRLADTITAATKAFEEYDYTTALQKIEECFWNFCDNYLELVKVVAYKGGDSNRRKSAIATLDFSLQTFLRLFSPFVPFITEEIWAWSYSEICKSIHIVSWPEVNECKEHMAEDSKLFSHAVEVISKINACKTENKKSLRNPVAKLVLTGSKEDIELVLKAKTYLEEAGSIADFETVATNNKQESLFNLDLTLGEEETTC